AVQGDQDQRSYAFTDLASIFAASVTSRRKSQSVWNSANAAAPVPEVVPLRLAQAKGWSGRRPSGCAAGLGASSCAGAKRLAPPPTSPPPATRFRSVLATSWRCSSRPCPLLQVQACRQSRQSSGGRLKEEPHILL